MNLTNYGIASERAERAEAEVYREHQAVEGWSLRAERAEARVAELEAALVNASDALPDPMHPAFPRELVDGQIDALAIIADALSEPTEGSEQLLQAQGRQAERSYQDWLSLE